MWCKSPGEVPALKPQYMGLNSLNLSPPAPKGGLDTVKNLNALQVQGC